MLVKGPAYRHSLAYSAADDTGSLLHRPGKQLPHWLTPGHRLSDPDQPGPAPHSVLVPRWLGWFGLAASLVYLLNQGPSVPGLLPPTGLHHPCRSRLALAEAVRDGMFRPIPFATTARPGPTGHLEEDPWSPCRRAGRAGTDRPRLKDRRDITGYADVAST
jgi:hypothetical protein